MPVMTGHRPDLLVTLLRFGQRMRGDQGPSGLSGRLRLPALRRLSPLRFGLPPAPGAFRHVNQSTEPRDRHARHQHGSLRGPGRAQAILRASSSISGSQPQPHPTPESTRRPRLQAAAPRTWTYPPQSRLCRLQGTAVPSSRSPARKPSPSGLPQQSRSHLDAELFLHRDRHRMSQNNSDLSARALHQQLTTPAT